MNNQTQEALKMAIEALENACFKIEKWTKGGKWTAGKEASAKCKEALAEAEKQEPVAWMYQVNQIYTQFSDIEPSYDEYDEGSLTPLYTHPTTWQSLSDDEMDDLFKKHGVMFLEGNFKFARAIEQALKEKNHG